MKNEDAVWELEGGSGKGVTLIGTLGYRISIFKWKVRKSTMYLLTNACRK